MALSYTISHKSGGDSFAALKPQVWSETRLRDTTIYSNYDLAPDGKRLATMFGDVEASGQGGPTHLTCLLNFFDELRRRPQVGGKVEPRSSPTRHGGNRVHYPYPIPTLTGGA